MCDDSFARFLFEMSARTEWEPINCQASNYYSSLGVISFFEHGEPVDSYWKQWGGWYDNPKDSQIEIFVKTYLTAVDSLNQLKATEFSYWKTGTVTYINTPLYLWQYYNTDLFLSQVVGFSSSVRDTHSPSDDTYSGVRYPVRLGIPNLGMTSLPDPIKGIVPLPAFSVKLDNSDGYFDKFDTQRFFNSPVRIKKSTVSRPSISDFKTIRTGFVDSVDVDFSEYRIRVFEPVRAFTQQVCRPITAELFNGVNPEIVGKPLPIAYGSVRKCPLIKISETEGDFRYIACDPEYLASVSVVYNSDGGSVLFSQSGGVITTMVDAESADIVGKMPCSTGEILVSEISQKAEQPYTEGIWDTSEVDRYLLISPQISLFFASGTVKQLIAQVLQNDSAFLFTKNDGRLTIRRFGMVYEYHIIPSWIMTQKPEKGYSDSRYFLSSVSVEYNRNFKNNKSESVFLYDQKETEVFEIYTKRNRLTYSTSLIEYDEAVSLALRLFSRFSVRLESIKCGTGYDCSEINPLDTVSMPVVVNGRQFSTVQKWTVLSSDPAQDKLEIEEYTTAERDIPGTTSFPSNSNESGVTSFPSNQNESGETANPTVKG